VTVKEIAALAGVSTGTVDRVLYHRGRVSPETKQKVGEIILRHGFTPNPIARRLKRGRPYCFCALLPLRHQDAGYWGQVLQGIKSGADELSPLGVETKIIEYDRYSIESFNDAAQSVIADQPEGVIFAPIMPEKTRPFIEDLQNSRIPIVYLDADIPHTKPLCTVGPDFFKGGILAGRLMDLFIGNDPARRDKTLAVLDAHGEDYHLTRRRDGFLHYAKAHGFRVLAMEYFSTQGLELTNSEYTRFLREAPPLAGVFITNCMTYRVAESVPAAPPLVIIGYDLIPENRLMLGDGRIDAIICQHPETQGREALQALYRHVVLEQTIPPLIEIPLDVYIRENIPPR
jgi:LacI family transcriptional regulator